MKNLGKILFSQKLTIVLLSIFAFAVALATFIENKHDTETAKELIYNSKRMEFLLLLLSVNLIGTIFKRKLYLKAKLTILMFHLGFIVMILGAALTRYAGFEGTMHIREGEASSELFSREIYFRVIPSPEEPEVFEDVDIDKLFKKPVSIETSDGNEIIITQKNYIYDAVEQIVENSPDGKDIVHLIVETPDGNVSDYLSEGEVKPFGHMTFSFNNNSDSTAVQIVKSEGKLFVKANADIYRSLMGGAVEDTVIAFESGDFIPNKVYNIKDDYFFFKSFFNKGKKLLVHGSPDVGAPDALIADISYKGVTEEVKIFGGNGYRANLKDYKIGDKLIQIGYGNVPIQLPFSIYLKDFIMKRYPGSNSPSSFESDVMLIDERENLNMDYKIYMNNILDHDGYRFFQSSYDRDEKGTILSVNHDMPGTIVTYISYVLLLLGFVSTFLNKKSRFRTLSRRIRKTRTDRKAVVSVIILLLGLSFTASSQTNLKNPVSIEHADKFGKLIVQTFDGRFEPVHTLANDVVIKIYKKSNFNDEVKGNLNGMQLYMDFIIDSEYWKNKPIVYIKNPDLKSIIGISAKYASFNNFFDQNGMYKLAEYSESAYEKSKADKSKFDQEVMKVNERLNILLMTFRGGMLKIFPDMNSDNHKWLSLDDSAAYRPLTGSINAINEDLQLTTLTYSNILRLYFQHLSEATITGNYTRSDQILGYISNIQRQTGTSDILPSESKINLEIHYNKAKIFSMLKYFYMILSVILLLLTFADHLRSKKGKLLTWAVNFFIALLALGFLYHTYGLVLRWYLSGHAPWSNGYEALIFVAWGGLLAGFIFMRYSKITLAATALLAFLITMVAGFSSYDPQLTNLQPVLKSYWLIIHVAVIVISYGFLGLGFILGLINLFTYVSMNKSNSKKLISSIKDLSNINEMTLLIGIVLATVGTFLGAVWANESWGRYWGWDAKETWALIILLVYAVVLHLRLIPSMNKLFIFNTASVIAFGTVIMTFFGVNYYFTKGLHSYASGDKAVFPTWALVAIFILIILIIFANFKNKKFEIKGKDNELKEE